MSTLIAPGYEQDPNGAPGTVRPIGGIVPQNPVGDLQSGQSNTIGAVNTQSSIPTIPIGQAPVPPPASVNPSQYGTSLPASQGGGIVATPSVLSASANGAVWDPNTLQWVAPGQSTSSTTAQSTQQPTSSVAGAAATTDIPQVSSVAGAATGQPAPTTPAPGTPSVVDVLKAVNQNPQLGSQLASQFGVQGYNGTAAQNQQLAQKYTSYFNQVSGSAAPSTNPRSDILDTTSALAKPDPQQSFFDQYGSMNPVLQQIYNMTAQVSSPQSQAQLFNMLYQSTSLPAGAQGESLSQEQLANMNIQRIMTGTEDDIRSEVTAAGGFATESQVQGMVATRNKVLLKQAAVIQQSMQLKSDYVNQVVQLTGADQTEVDTQVNQKIGLLETAASMQQTMNQNSISNYQKTLTTLGGDYGAFAGTVPDNMKPTVENLMGLAPGTLSDPQELQILTNSSLKLMQLQIASQRAAVYGYNAGYGVTVPNPLGGSSTQTTSTGAPNPASNLNQPISPFLNTTDPNSYTVKPQDTLSTIGKNFGITSQAGLQAFQKINGITDPSKLQPGQPLTIPIPVSLNSDPTQTGYIDPSLFDPSTYTQIGGTPVPPKPTGADTAYQNMVASVKQAQSSAVSTSPINLGRMSRAAQTALKLYVSSATYQTVSNAVPYLSRIQSAMKDPGSISDTSLADSIIKIETGGGQVTDSQISTYFNGQSFADHFAVVGDKIVAKGGVLSPQQRKDLSGLAESTFSYYQQQYEGLYVQAMNNLIGQKIPLQYGGNLPDFTTLLAQSALPQ